MLLWIGGVLIPVFASPDLPSAVSDLDEVDAADNETKVEDSCKVPLDVFDVFGFGSLDRTLLECVDDPFFVDQASHGSLLLIEDLEDNDCTARGNMEAHRDHPVNVLVGVLENLEHVIPDGKHSLRSRLARGGAEWCGPRQSDP